MSRRQTLFRSFLAGAILLGFFAAVASLYLMRDHAAGEKALRIERDDLEARGLLVPLDRLVPKPSPEGIRNGEELLRLLEDLKPLGKEFPNLLNGPETMAFIRPGTAAPAASRPVPLLHPPKGETSPSWSELRDQYVRAAPILAQARMAWAQPVGLDHQQASLKPRYDLGGLQKYGAWLRSGTMLEIHDGNLSEAMENLWEMRHISVLMGSSKNLVPAVMEIGMWTFTVYGPLWEILQAPGLTDLELRELQELLSQENFLEKSILAMKVEVAIAPEVFATMARLSSQDISWTALSTPGPEHLVPLRNALWPYAWADGDLARVFSFWKSAIPLAQELALKRNWREILPRIPEDPDLSDFDEWRFPFSSISVSGGMIRGLLLSTVKIEARRQLALAAVALARYKLTYGRYPDSLAELTPYFLTSVPRDWFDGEPLKYRLLPDGRYLLYSVHEDGVDDGGDPSAKKGETTLNNGRDLVWPTAENP